MAYITIKPTTDEGGTMLTERILPSDTESEFFCPHLVERLLSNGPQLRRAVRVAACLLACSVR